MRTALLLLLSTVVLADPAADVLNVFSAAAEALTNDDSSAFLDNFDRNMPQYAALRTNIEGLLAGYEVGSTIEVVTDEGDDEKRIVSLDWLLVTSEKNAVNGDQQTRRRIVKCSLERRGKQWRIIALDPIDFFKP
jgi:murein L,D-transpeptidase YcbB/YkuD